MERKQCAGPPLLLAGEVQLTSTTEQPAPPRCTWRHAALDSSPPERPSSRPPWQSMARKLRIFPGERHEFEGHPALLPFQMPPRKLREKGELFEMPPGFEPLNPQAYFKRFGHRLGKQQQGSDAAQQQAAAGSDS